MHFCRAPLQRWEGPDIAKCLLYPPQVWHGWGAAGCFGALGRLGAEPPAFPSWALEVSACQAATASLSSSRAASRCSGMEKAAARSRRAAATWALMVASFMRRLDVCVTCSPVPLHCLYIYN